MPHPSVSDTQTVSGFFGKLPARGDFLRAGLPRSFVEPWDEWLQQAIAGSRALLGAAWVPAWMEAPIWRFCLPAGLCGPDAVLGLWMPSVDSAGRHFPLTLARIGAVPDAAAWLAGAIATGLDALNDAIVPEALAASLQAPAGPGRDPIPDPPPPGHALWWTDGAPLVPPTSLVLARLPDAAAFAAMLDASFHETSASPHQAGGVRE